MRQIELKGKVVSIIHKIDDWKSDLDFLTPNESFIQAGTWWYNKGKELKAHRHKIYSRQVEQTQETVVVISGKMAIQFYDETNKIFKEIILETGDICVILDVGHGYKILEDNTKIIEVKNGPFISVELDKKLI